MMIHHSLHNVCSMCDVNCSSAVTSLRFVSCGGVSQSGHLCVSELPDTCQKHSPCRHGAECVNTLDNAGYACR